jgi:hypothetical protein
MTCLNGTPQTRNQRLIYAQVHTAGFYDDVGFCEDCDTPIAITTGTCPRAALVTAPAGSTRARTRTGSTDLLEGFLIGSGDYWPVWLLHMLLHSSARSGLRQIVCGCAHASTDWLVLES